MSEYSVCSGVDSRTESSLLPSAAFSLSSTILASERTSLLPSFRAALTFEQHEPCPPTFCRGASISQKRTHCSDSRSTGFRAQQG